MLLVLIDAAQHLSNLGPLWPNFGRIWPQIWPTLGRRWPNRRRFEKHIGVDQLRPDLP